MLPINYPTLSSFISQKGIFLRCRYWFLISLTSYFTVGTSRWDAVYTLIFMLQFPLSITISNETVFVLKFTVFKSALFIATCFSLPWRPRYWATFSDMMVVSDQCPVEHYLSRSDWNVSELLVIFPGINVLNWRLNDYWLLVDLVDFVDFLVPVCFNYQLLNQPCSKLKLVCC